MTRQQITELARRRSAELVQELKDRNADRPEARYVTEKDYDRFRRLLERKIVRYSS